MRVGVIRGDLTAGPIFLADLEPTSQTNNPVDPVAQTRYIARPDLTLVGRAMAPIPAAVESTGDITLPLAVVGGGVSDTLRINTGSGMVVATIAANAGYASMTLLIAAVNAALVAAGIPAVAEVGVSALRLRLKTTTSKGPGAIITVDTVGNGSTANTGLVFGAGGLTFTVPTALATITSMNPVGGPVDVSLTKMLLVSKALQTGATVNALGVALADTIAPHFVETDVAIKSFEVGNLAGLRSLTYVPDPHRVPAMTPGPAISVVQDDGVSLFAAAMPMITAAVHNVPAAGDLTITGVGMANTERDETVVDVMDPVTGVKIRLTQKLIRSTLTGGTQGVVTPTSIVIPKSLLIPVGSTTSLCAAAGAYVSLQYTSFANNNYGNSLTVASVTNGVATLTGLARMNANSVGKKLTLSGGAVAGNNGTFFIASVLSPTSVTIQNIYADATDGNNGLAAFVWNETIPVVFIAT